MMKRRIKKKTDYKQRLRLLRSEMPRLVIRRGLNRINVQIIKYEPKGDKTIFSTSSKRLLEYGWNYHLGNIPSAYLTGLLTGKKAIEKGIKEAIVDIGLQENVHGSSLYAVVKGAIDAGMKIPVGKDAFPSEDRIKGKHIADYAEEAKTKQSVKKDAEPKSIVQAFERVKASIIEK